MLCFCTTEPQRKYKLLCLHVMRFNRSTIYQNTFRGGGIRTSIPDEL